MLDAALTALGIALSPLPVIPAILLLFSPRSAAGSAAFGGGWAAGIAAVCVTAVLFADVLTLPDNPPAWAIWTQIVLGAALLVYGLLQLRPGPESAETPAWLRSMESATPGSAARFGLLASVPNPKVALLAVAGGFSIGSALEGWGREVAAVAGFTALAASTSLLPVLAYLIAGERIRGPLGRAKDWLTTNLKLTVGIVLLLIGALLLWKGLTSL